MSHPITSLPNQPKPANLKPSSSSSPFAIQASHANLNAIHSLRHPKSSAPSSTHGVSSSKTIAEPNSSIKPSTTSVDATTSYTQNNSKFKTNVFTTDSEWAHANFEEVLDYSDFSLVRDSASSAPNVQAITSSFITHSTNLDSSSSTSGNGSKQDNTIAGIPSQPIILSTNTLNLSSFHGHNTDIPNTHDSNNAFSKQSLPSTLSSPIKTIYGQKLASAPAVHSSILMSNNSLLDMNHQYQSLYEKKPSFHDTPLQPLQATSTAMEQHTDSQQSAINQSSNNTNSAYLISNFESQQQQKKLDIQKKIKSEFDQFDQMFRELESNPESISWNAPSSLKSKSLPLQQQISQQDKSNSNLQSSSSSRFQPQLDQHQPQQQSQAHPIQSTMTSASSSKMAANSKLLNPAMNHSPLAVSSPSVNSTSPPSLQKTTSPPSAHSTSTVNTAGTTTRTNSTFSGAFGSKSRFTSTLTPTLPNESKSVLSSINTLIPSSSSLLQSHPAIPNVPDKEQPLSLSSSSSSAVTSSTTTSNPKKRTRAQSSLAAYAQSCRDSQEKMAKVCKEFPGWSNWQSQLRSELHRSSRIQANYPLFALSHHLPQLATSNASNANVLKSCGSFLWLLSKRDSVISLSSNPHEAQSIFNTMTDKLISFSTTPFRNGEPGVLEGCFDISNSFCRLARLIADAQKKDLIRIDNHLAELLPNHNNTTMSNSGKVLQPGFPPKPSISTTNRVIANSTSSSSSSLSSSHSTSHLIVSAGVRSPNFSNEQLHSFSLCPSSISNDALTLLKKNLLERVELFTRMLQLILELCESFPSRFPLSLFRPIQEASALKQYSYPFLNTNNHHMYNTADSYPDNIREHPRIKMNLKLKSSGSGAECESNRPSAPSSRESSSISTYISTTKNENLLSSNKSSNRLFISEILSFSLEMSDPLQKLSTNIFENQTGPHTNLRKVDSSVSASSSMEIDSKSTTSQLDFAKCNNQLTHTIISLLYTSLALSSNHESQLLSFLAARAPELHKSLNAYLKSKTFSSLLSSAVNTKSCSLALRLIELLSSVPEIEIDWNSFIHNCSNLTAHTQTQTYSQPNENANHGIYLPLDISCCIQTALFERREELMSSFKLDLQQQPQQLHNQTNQTSTSSQSLFLLMRLIGKVRDDLLLLFKKQSSTNFSSMFDQLHEPNHSIDNDKRYMLHFYEDYMPSSHYSKSFYDPKIFKFDASHLNSRLQLSINVLNFVKNSSSIFKEILKDIPQLAGYLNSSAPLLWDIADILNHVLTQMINIIDPLFIPEISNSASLNSNTSMNLDPDPTVMHTDALILSGLKKIVSTCCAEWCLISNYISHRYENISSDDISNNQK